MTGSTTLHGRHAVVTGGARGLGAAIAAALEAEGANVTVMARSARPGSAARTRAVACDVSDPVSVERAFADAVTGFGPVHILINNAGQAAPAALQDVTLADWQRLLAVNLTGAFLCAQQVLPAMTAAGTGRIINIASTAGLKGYAKSAAYCASKHGLVGLTRAMATELARTGVTVNAVCPGYIEDTGMLREAVENVSRSGGRTEADARAILARQSPRGVLTTPAEVANTVLWLCSPGASAITGQAIAVAGGEVM